LPCQRDMKTRKPAVFRPVTRPSESSDEFLPPFSQKEKILATYWVLCHSLSIPLLLLFLGQFEASLLDCHLLCKFLGVLDSSGKFSLALFFSLLTLLLFAPLRLFLLSGSLALHFALVLELPCSLPLILCIGHQGGRASRLGDVLLTCSLFLSAARSALGFETAADVEALLVVLDAVV
jgi:hypothetical protein